MKQEPCDGAFVARDFRVLMHGEGDIFVLGGW